MHKWIVLYCLCFQYSSAFAEPSQEQIFELNTSIVQVIVVQPDGSSGSGSGVVVNHDYVATDCHVLAGASGVNITKNHESYTPKALRADWKHDVCLLRFEGLPFKSIPMRDTTSLQYEEGVFSISYPNDNQVPQTSFGNIKAIYPYDDSVIVRASAAFALGSSGGALFDHDFNLIGITTFKSPGRDGYFYSLPVEWIKALFDAPDLISLQPSEKPFWSYAEAQRPFFMQVVIPYKHQDWDALARIAGAWTLQEPNNTDAWYYLGMSQYQHQLKQEARVSLTKAVALNNRNLEALVALGLMAVDAGNKPEARRLALAINVLDSDESDSLNKRIATMQ